MFNTLTHPSDIHSRIVYDSIITPIWGVMTRSTQNFAVWRRKQRIYRETYDSLTRLSPRILKDIGFNPGDIGRIAREARDLA